MDLGIDLSSITDKLKDILPILSYALSMIEKVLNLFGFYFRDERPEVTEEPSAEA